MGLRSDFNQLRQEINEKMSTVLAGLAALQSAEATLAGAVTNAVNQIASLAQQLANYNSEDPQVQNIAAQILQQAQTLTAAVTPPAAAPSPAPDLAPVAAASTKNSPTRAGRVRWLSRRTRITKGCERGKEKGKAETVWSRVRIRFSRRVQQQDCGGKAGAQRQRIFRLSEVRAGAPVRGPDRASTGGAVLSGVSKHGRRTGHIIGNVYLVHLARSLNGARHYLGFSTDIPKRIKAHRAGRGTPLLGAATKKKIPWRLVRTWRNRDGYFEQELKRGHDMKDLCPVCSRTKGGKRV